MQFDLHSELADQITIENLKWHRDRLAEDLGKEDAFIHEEDQQYYAQLLTHINVVIGYSTIEGVNDMIDDESEPGSWKQAIEWMNQMKNKAPIADRPNAEDYRNRAERAEAECQELQEQADILMEKCRQWKQSTEMLCAIHSDHITLGDLYRAGVTVSFSVE